MRRLDLLLGLALTALGLLMALGEGPWLAVLTIPAVTLPVIWRERAPLAAAAAVAAGAVISGAPTFDQPRCGVAIPAALAFVVPLCAGVWACGRLVRSRTRLADALAARTRELAERREETARLAVELDRLRLAGALDAAARDRLRAIVERSAAAGPDDAREAFVWIEQAGRASLDEMRDLLGVLRSDGTSAGERACPS
jgi:hypothetical protein